MKPCAEHEPRSAELPAAGLGPHGCPTTLPSQPRAEPGATAGTYGLPNSAFSQTQTWDEAGLSKPYRAMELAVRCRQHGGERPHSAVPLHPQRTWRWFAHQEPKIPS